MRHQPAHPHALRWKLIAIRPQRGDKDEEECGRQGKDSQGDGLVEPPDQEEEARDDKCQQGLDFAHTDGHPAVGLDQHLDHGDEMKEEGQSAEVDAGLTPRDRVIEDSREDGDTSTGIEKGRNS